MLLSSLSLAGFFLLTSSSAHSIDKSCICLELRPAGLHVNCSSLNLMQLPLLPSLTTELHLEDNQFTSVSPGLFDRFFFLKKVSLSGNPFHCDCRIQYLRNWLLRNKGVVSEEPVCSSPSSVAQKAISELPDDYFSTCKLTSCAYLTYTTVLGVMLCCLILLLLWNLRLARRSTFILSFHERHSGLEAYSLQSLKPRHRRRVYTGLSGVSEDSDSLTWSEKLERPLINMELLPQVLDVLHKKHNIKIKAT
ncbi:glycoprotein IX (platelet) [Melanotaenia boesemani]|uniref:glycoprotein IX (platelet) n=1 Tax=Melanotaenia boesemani TaxID=1250792 RepID=UPI001C04788F|nr:glycoprotein IX (platelet) [Melanotaenia boesemani]XP_041859297.1 glycoprotein IX (platelet) [Melanotaenia boesemani]XP_041859298.1 glycoprotein IX (platelet) [Melanotaenia boesemani]